MPFFVVTPDPQQVHCPRSEGHSCVTPRNHRRFLRWIQALSPWASVRYASRRPTASDDAGRDSGCGCGRRLDAKELIRCRDRVFGTHTAAASALRVARNRGHRGGVESRIVMADRPAGAGWAPPRADPASDYRRFGCGRGLLGGEHAHEPCGDGRAEIEGVRDLLGGVPAGAQLADLVRHVYLGCHTRSVPCPEADPTRGQAPIGTAASASRRPGSPASGAGGRTPNAGTAIVAGHELRPTSGIPHGSCRGGDLIGQHRGPPLVNLAVPADKRSRPARRHDPQGGRSTRCPTEPVGGPQCVARDARRRAGTPWAARPRVRRRAARFRQLVARPR